MRIRVDKLAMVVVGAFGLYALYRLTQTSTSSQLTTPKPGKPAPLPVTTGPLPTVAGPIPAPPTSISMVEGGPLQLGQARWYHGRLETMQQPAPFSDNASRKQLVAALTGMGFNQVQVFMTPTEAQGDIFQAFALANPGKGTRWFRVRWPLQLENTLPFPARPPQMVLLWNAAAPS